MSDRPSNWKDEIINSTFVFTSPSYQPVASTQTPPQPFLLILIYSLTLIFSPQTPATEVVVCEKTISILFFNFFKVWLASRKKYPTANVCSVPCEQTGLSSAPSGLPLSTVCWEDEASQWSLTVHGPWDSIWWMCCHKYWAPSSALFLPLHSSRRF